MMSEEVFLMKDNVRKQSQNRRLMVYLLAVTVMAFGLAFLMMIQPVSASAPAQAGTSTLVATTTLASTLEPSATSAAVATTAPTAAATTAAGTSSGVSTLAAPSAGNGTPTALVPVTGADLTQPDPTSRLAFEIGLGLLGLILIVYGISSRLAKR
jgi:hypothetical protein